MTLAKEAMRVPHPPMFTPNRSPIYSSLNADKKIAAGTLLINWLVKAETNKAFLFITAYKNSFTCGISAKLPAKIKNAIKVSNKE